MNDRNAVLSRHSTNRVRHETVRRALTVVAVEDVTPRLRRLVLGGPELAGFNSASYDDHIKLIFPLHGGAGETASRNITPRRFDAAANTLDVEIALHEGGPVSEWARNAQTGSPVSVGGPRGSLVVTPDFDWYVLAGDETAIPAIGRRLEELPAGARAFAIVEVAGSADEVPLASPADVQTTWLHRGDAAPGTTAQLENALEALALPAGDGYVFVACEFDIAKRVRNRFVERGVPKEWQRVAAYWKRDASDVHENIND